MFSLFYISFSYDTQFFHREPQRFEGRRFFCTQCISFRPDPLFFNIISAMLCKRSASRVTSDPVFSFPGAAARFEISERRGNHGPSSPSLDHFCMCATGVFFDPLFILSFFSPSIAISILRARGPQFRAPFTGSSSSAKRGRRVRELQRLTFYYYYFRLHLQ